MGTIEPMLERAAALPLRPASEWTPTLELSAEPVLMTLKYRTTDSR